MAEPEPGADRGPGLHLVEPGLWVEATGRVDWPKGRPALFLDRDGTINVDTDFPSHPDEVVLREEMLDVIRAANRAEIPAVVVSNQSGIARGYFGWGEFAAVNARVLDLLRGEGCSVDLVIACAYYPGGQGPLAIADHPMRKPNPGMLLLARDRLGLDLARSIMVGDKLSDMEAAHGAGLAAGWLIGRHTVDFPGFSVKGLQTDADRLALVQSIAGLRPSVLHPQPDPSDGRRMTAATSTTPSPRRSRGEGKGEGRRRR